MLILRILFLFWGLAAVSSLNGQEIIRSAIGSSGSTAFSGGILLRQTIGQPPGTDVIGDDRVMLRQGFQQAVDHHSVTSAPLIPADLPDEGAGFTMFPNPARNHVDIVLAAESVPFDMYISNLQGNRLYHVTAVTDARITLDLQSLAPGIYFVTVTNAAGRSTRRLMIL